MQNNLSSCTIVKFVPSEKTDENLQTFLDEYFEVSALNYNDDGTETYVGYAELNFDPQDLEKAAQAMNVLLPEFSVEKLENINWLTENVIKFDPIETDDFCIYGIHEKTAPKTDKLLLKIYAATAFGSGHQTTKCCLNAISELNHMKYLPLRILDMGTGSGILALACAQIWKAHQPQITAVDIDDEAVRVAMQNAFDNHLEQFLSVAQSDGYASTLVHKNGPYDLIIANILARPLIEMVPQLSQYLKTGGYCILSGFVTDQFDWVVSAHENCGLQLRKSYHIDNWYAVLMEKK